MFSIDRHLDGRRLHTLVENQTSYGLAAAEMHIFETHTRADKVLLEFREPVLASMIVGKKIMHLDQEAPFDFVPGESLVLPAEELMCIDFPVADLDTPTRCLAMTIDPDMIHATVDFLNDRQPRAQGGWSFADYNFHFSNDQALQQIIQRLLYLFTEEHQNKDLFADMMLKELIVRILQQESSQTISQHAESMSTSHPLAHVVDYIRNHLSERMTATDLSKRAYMSESTFHRAFKREMGMTATEFIMQQRIGLAVSMLADPRIKIKDIFVRCGFNSQSYFLRLFKNRMQMSPGQYRKQMHAESPWSSSVEQGEAMGS